MISFDLIFQLIAFLVHNLAVGSHSKSGKWRFQLSVHLMENSPMKLTEALEY